MDRKDRIIKRCKDLGIPTSKADGKPYALGTLRNKLTKAVAEQRWEQCGGDPMLMTAASKLAVPAALALAREYIEKNYKKSQAQSQSQSGGGNHMYGGVTGKIANDPLINNYLRMTGGSNLFTDTLIPLGILITAKEAATNLYERGSILKTEKQTGGAELNALLSDANLNRFATVSGLAYLTPQTLVPFALVVGQKAFDHYLQKKTKKLRIEKRNK